VTNAPATGLAPGWSRAGLVSRRDRAHRDIFSVVRRRGGWQRTLADLVALRQVARACLRCSRDGMQV